MINVRNLWREGVMRGMTNMLSVRVEETPNGRRVVVCVLGFAVYRKR